ncbi:MAG TPA: type II toxin-antitoxin system VapC family toxin [Terriglobales bacterium]|nr:type II toxin-antitoxin system VapC family toxin [Terriglobales bacterium]
MNLYLESSAALADWLEEPKAFAVRSLLRDPAQVITSELTLIECDRAFFRAEAIGRLSAAAAIRLQGAASTLWTQCHVLAFETGVVSRARDRFASEPIRTWDALHLAFLELAQQLAGNTAMLSLDDRVRTAARALGATVLPETV